MGKVTKKKKAVKVDFFDSASVIKMLNNKKTTIEYVCSNLQDIVDKFRDTKEDYYVNELKEQIDKNPDDVTDEDLQRWADKIQKLVVKDTKGFVKTYIEKMNDNILDAINDNTVHKDPAHAFLLLLQTLEKAFQKTLEED